MAAFTVQKSSATGLVASFAAAVSTSSASPDTFPNTGNEKLHVNNGGASAITVTLIGEKPCNQGFTHDAVISVAAGSEEIIGPLKTTRFTDASGNANFYCSSVSSVTVAVIGE